MSEVLTVPDYALLCQYVHACSVVGEKSIMKALSEKKAIESTQVNIDAKTMKKGFRVLQTLQQRIDCLNQFVLSSLKGALAVHCVESALKATCIYTREQASSNVCVFAQQHSCKKKESFFMVSFALTVDNEVQLSQKFTVCETWMRVLDAGILLNKRSEFVLHCIQCHDSAALVHVREAIVDAYTFVARTVKCDSMS